MCKLPKQYTEKKHTINEIYTLYKPLYLADPKRTLRIEDKHLEAIQKTLSCRSLDLGAVIIQCEECDAVKYLYHTCKHRFCPTCGAANTHQWALTTLGNLLEMPHHHIVATLPKQLRKLSKMNGDKLHNILFIVAAKIVQEIFEKKYNVKPGIISVLHTSGSDLKYHPHVHMIVSRGGKRYDTSLYKSIDGKYLVKNEILGKRLKELFEKELLKENKKGNIKLYKQLEGEGKLEEWLSKQKEKTWIVNIEKPLEEVLQIVNYVGRYTKRACISEYKIEEITPNIKFRYKDYKNSKRGEKPLESIIEMTPTEFLDKLLQHVPNKRYRMVRYYGLYNSYYNKQIPKEIRAKIDEKEEIVEIDRDENYDWGEFEIMRKHAIKNGYKDFMFCYKCNRDMKVIGIVNKHGEIYEYNTS